MALDKFVIAPMTAGLQNDVKPFMIPDDAFERLNNAYVFRGRVRKRFGSRLMRGTSPLDSRLRINVGTTDGSGDLSVTVPGAVFKIGQAFSIGTEMFTVVETGTPGTMTSTGAATVKTYNTTTGALVINGAALTTDCYFYPSEPVMGLMSYQIPAVNDETLIAFDTQFSYRYASSGWQRIGTGAAAEWTGDNYEFFWGASYRGIESKDSYLFVTNNNATDGVRYWDNSAWTKPTILTNATDTIEGARLVVPFKNRLLLLNVTEKVGGNTVSITNRIRYSQNGSPVAANAFRDDTPGLGNWIETTKKEAIISAKLIRDRLIVFSESSTNELVWTGNDSDPFIFQQINEELGVESAFSTVVFDKHVLGVGDVGIHACNGASVERIDEKIPLEVFKISNTNEGLERVHGVRDYVAEMVYWTYSPSGTDAIYPRKVLSLNYKTGSWGINDDSFTCFGYYQNAVGVTWAELTTQWQENSEVWSSGAYDLKYQNVIAGNQQGFVLIIDPEVSRNAPSLQVTTTYDSLVSPGLLAMYVRDHNLTIEDYVALEDTGGFIGIAKVDSVQDVNNITLYAPYFSGTYTGGATLARVSRMDIQTKHYNFYFKEGKNMFIPTVEFYVDRTQNGEVTIDVSTSSSNASLLVDGSTTGALLGSNVLETKPYSSIPYEATQERYWHRFYPQATGETIQLKISLSDDQIVNPDIAWSPFELNAMAFYANSITR